MVIVSVKENGGYSDGLVVQILNSSYLRVYMPCIILADLRSSQSYDRRTNHIRAV